MPLLPVESIQQYISGELAELCATADRVRQEAVGDRVFLRGLIEFSNYCNCNCVYCGLRHANTDIVRYRIDDAAIVAAASSAYQAGVDTIVLQSGEDPANTPEGIAAVVAQIKQNTGLPITLSLGNQTTATYKLWRDAGADRYLIKHETADPELYATLHPGETFARRIDSLHRLRDLGYAIGTGFIVGIAGQTDATLEKDIALVQSLGAEMCGVGPFIPQQSTPFSLQPAGSVTKTLEVLARLRIACPTLNMPATTALASLAPEQGHILALLAGANVIMPNFTPAVYKRNYRIYDGKLSVDMALALRSIQATKRSCALSPQQMALITQREG